MEFMLGLGLCSVVGGVSAAAEGNGLPQIGGLRQEDALEEVLIPGQDLPDIPVQLTRIPAGIAGNAHRLQPQPGGGDDRPG